MRTLLVQPLTPKTYWNFEDAVWIAGRAASLPPLGLATVAALLPREWEIRIADLNVRPLSDAEILWADVVMVTGMLVHADSAREVLARSRRLGIRTVIGGPAATGAPEDFPDAEIVFRGEAEGRIDELLAELSSPSRAHRVLSTTAEPPDIALAAVPRFDLLSRGSYTSLSIQYTRGCPFHCEFCDVVELFGRRPRVKSPPQVLAELDALYAAGYRGTVFFVDDNFIGNRRATAELLPELTRWQAEHDWPYDFYTEASVDLAGHPELIRAMVGAGFADVFLGLESPSGAALAQAGKHQNLRLSPEEAVDLLTRGGLQVMSGFIVGFDADGPEIFEAQRSLIAAIPVPLAMVGVLTAMRGTGLWKRLEREGRTRDAGTGDQFARPNFVPRMDERTLLAGYRDLLASIYSTDAYYDRCERVIDRIGPPTTPRHVRPGGVRALLRSMLFVGVLSARRWRYWRLLWRALTRAPHAFVRAVVLGVQGEHLIRYTAEHVLPRLNAELEAMERAAAPSAEATPLPLPLPLPPLAAAEIRQSPAA